MPDVHAGLALKRAKLVDQAAKGQLRATELNALAVHVDLEKTLSFFVGSIQEILRCDAVTLFVYNEETKRIVPLTTMAGVIHLKNVTHCEDAPPDSIVYRMLERDEPYIVFSVADDPLFQPQRFVSREKIESVCAIPMKVNEHRVGVTFVNYRSLHAITKAELDGIQPLIQSAAVQILNALRYKESYGFVNLSRQLIGARNLKESIHFALTYAAERLGTDFVAMVLLDNDGRTRIEGWKGWTDEEVAAYQDFNQTRYTMDTGDPVVVPDYATENRFSVPSIVLKRGFKSGVSVPMQSGAKLVGAMLAHFIKSRDLLEAQVGTLSLIANLAAIAVQHHRAVESKVSSLSAVIHAADEISKIRMGTDATQVFYKIIEQAVRCIPQSFLGTVQTYDKEKNILRCECVHFKDSGESDKRLDHNERTLEPTADQPLGITARAVLTGEPQLVNNVRKHPDYLEFQKETESELAVPLLDENGKVLGVLNVESKVPSAFDEDDQQVLSALAKLVVTTIQNAEQYRLREGSMLLAWFGMESSLWGHSVAQKSDSIRNNIKLLRWDLEDYSIDPDVQRILEARLNVIDDTAMQIRREPLVSLPQHTESTSDVDINQLISDRLDQLWCSAPYNRADLDLELTESNPLVRCSAEWINRMLDIIIDNAIDAMADTSSPRLVVNTRLLDGGGKVEIAITDNGPGIPWEIQDKLFNERIEKGAISTGLGTGLLMVRIIAEVYKGKVGIGGTGPAGTTMYVRLPVVQNRARPVDDSIGVALPPYSGGLEDCIV